VDDLSKRAKFIIHAIALADMCSILIVDDNEMNRNLAAEIFEEAGYVVHKTGSGQQGVKIATSVLPDTVLMDLSMPDIDGFEATQRLKQHAATSEIPVIAWSAFATRDFKEKAYRAGCEGYITKPIEPGHLVEQVIKLVMTSKIRRRVLDYGKDISDR
jgi:CheY-like chemotaxis protein